MAVAWQPIERKRMAGADLAVLDARDRRRRQLLAGQRVPGRRGDRRIEACRPDSLWGESLELQADPQLYKLAPDACRVERGLAIVFDPEKNRRNIATRGLSFERVAAFDWLSASVERDVRRDYGESRFVATGMIDGRLHVLVFTPRGADIRVISLRRANEREQAAHAEKARPLPHG